MSDISYTIAFDGYVPFSETKVSKDNSSMKVEVFPEEGLIKMESGYFSLTSPVKMQSDSEKRVKSFKIEQRYLKHFIDASGVGLIFYKKFVRIVKRNMIIDIGGEIKFG